MAKGKLTEKHKKFAREYLIDFNATKAYQRVYKVGAKVASASGTRLLGNVSIRSYLKKLTKKQEEKSETTAEWVIRELKDVLKRCKPKAPALGPAGTKTGESQFDSSGANRSLELIGKHIGMFIDRIEHTYKYEQVVIIIHQFVEVVKKHVKDPDIRNRIAKDIQALGL